MAMQIDCPSCGASVRYKRGDVSSQCKYCGNSVMIPPDMRGLDHQYPTTAATSTAGCGKKIGVLVSLAVFVVMGISALVFFLVAREADGSIKDSAVASILGGDAVALEFGGPGTGRGYFQDPECIAVDGAGNIYVGESESGRIQVFSPEGEYLYQWSYAQEGDFYLYAMSASYDGTLYIAYDSELFIHSGETGEYLGRLRHPDGWGFEDVDVGADGTIVASWYCNRDDILVYSENGELQHLIRNAIAGVTGDSELSIEVIGGNSGEILAFGSFNSVFVQYDDKGSFTDRFGDDDMFIMPSGFDVDPQGRLWVSDFGDLLVFSSSGEMVNRIDPGVSLVDFVIDDNYRLWGISNEDTIVMLDLSSY